MLVPVTIFIIYFSINNLWTEFISYTITGIKTFSNKVPYIVLFFYNSLYIKILAFIFPVQIIAMIIVFLSSYKIKNLEQKEWFKNLCILLVYAVASAVVIIPIADPAHFAVGSVCTLVAFIYSVYTLISYKIKKEQTKKAIEIYTDILSKILFAILLIWAATSIITYIKNEDRKTDIKHFENICVDQGLADGIKEIGDYIKQKEKVYILECSSAVFTIPIDQYNKNYDMFNLGNFGADGTQGIIKDIENTKNLTLLIKKEEYELNWQHPKEITDYVTKNFQKTGSVFYYDIYER